MNRPDGVPSPRLVIEHARDPKLRRDLKRLMAEIECYGYSEAIRYLMRLHEIATDEGNTSPPASTCTCTTSTESPAMDYEPLNSATAPLIVEVTKAAVHHYTAYSAGEDADCSHWHFKHHLRECPPYLDALQELIRTVNAEAQTKLGVISDSVGPVFRVWRGELLTVDGVGIQITRER